MNEPWETEPEVVKKLKELGDREDEGYKVIIPIISKRCNPEDVAWSIANKLFGWIWRR